MMLIKKCLPWFAIFFSRSFPVLRRSVGFVHPNSVGGSSPNAAAKSTGPCSEDQCPDVTLCSWRFDDVIV